MKTDNIFLWVGCGLTLFSFVLAVVDRIMTRRLKSKFLETKRIVEVLEDKLTTLDRANRFNYNKLHLAETALYEVRNLCGGQFSGRLAKDRIDRAFDEIKQVEP